MKFNIRKTNKLVRGYAASNMDLGAKRTQILKCVTNIKPAAKKTNIFTIISFKGGHPRLVSPFGI